MTIKEVEKLLEIPRATIRFYEKEGLIAPTREGNGYRDYSDEDVEKLKKIIILRKIGMPVEEISDLFDGAQSMNEALDTNIANLQKQMEELKGALKLSQRMKEDAVEVSSMDVNTYWNTIEEEEKLGHSFLDIAKDIVEVEKGVIAGFFAWTDVNGRPYDSWQKMIVLLVLAFALGEFA
ncbi:MAG: MerR family transcriptional regulator [Acetatifactor sp.]|nr:MerR family transcriptional regulator [Acetatifactor sp.]